jgi:hypothetical protein
MLTDSAPDPFRERSAAMAGRSIYLLGSRIEFRSNSRELLSLVDAAYQNLPRHRISSRVPELRITLWLSPAGGPGAGAREPPPLSTLSGAGLLGAATGSSSFLILAPEERAAIVVVSSAMLRFPYHTRYELIEFAVFTLAARVQRLVPLHAACVGKRGRGILLLGGTGAGKSTAALQCALAGFDFLSEDAVFLAPATMLATGVPNFFHLRAESLRWVERSVAAMIRHSPIIRRRSGVAKFEVDLRQEPFRLAARLKIVGVVVLTRRRAGQSLLRPLPRAQLLAMIAEQRAYGAGEIEWRLFKKALRVPAFELRRGQHPREAAEALETLL